MYPHPLSSVSNYPVAARDQAAADALVLDFYPSENPLSKFSDSTISKLFGDMLLDSEILIKRAAVEWISLTPEVEGELAKFEELIEKMASWSNIYTKRFILARVLGVLPTRQDILGMAMIDKSDQDNSIYLLSWLYRDSKGNIKALEYVGDATSNNNGARSIAQTKTNKIVLSTAFAAASHRNSVLPPSVPVTSLAHALFPLPKPSTGALSTDTIDSSLAVEFVSTLLLRTSVEARQKGSPRTLDSTFLPANQKLGGTGGNDARSSKRRFDRDERLEESELLPRDRIKRRKAPGIIRFYEQLKKSTRITYRHQAGSELATVSLTSSTPVEQGFTANDITFPFEIFALPTSFPTEMDGHMQWKEKGWWIRFYRDTTRNSKHNFDFVAEDPNKKRFPEGSIDSLTSLWININSYEQS